MSTLIHINGIPTFKSSKGFRYPEFWEFYKQHDRLHWTSDIISLSKDVQDFERASEEERTFITNVMKLFTQNEVDISLLVA